MSKILIIPDIHHHERLFKIWDKYEKKVDKIVLLGDFFDDFEVDDYDMQAYVDVYESIMKRLTDKVSICIGNHEMSYVWNRPVTGNSSLFFSAIREFAAKLYTGSYAVLKIDNCIFSHAGVEKDWFIRYYGKQNLSNLDQIMNKIKDDFWFGHDKIYQFWDADGNPLWSRPKLDSEVIEDEKKEKPNMYNAEQYMRFDNCWQFAGHTPMKNILRDSEQRIMFLDVFSALHQSYDHRLKRWMPDEFGCQKAIIVDSITCEVLKEVG